MTTFTYQERFKTLKGVFDEFTNRTLFILQSKGFFDELISPIFVGKESNVFSASKGKKKIIIKIYRIQNCDFKRMFHYIKQDPRYAFLKNKRRDIIFAWTQREYRNLLLAEKGKVNVPKALTFKNNVLIEEFIGNENPSPPLKDAYPKDPKKFFNDLIKQVKKLYQIGLIHGDLSAFNLLNHQETPCLIDFSQATLIRTPNSEELLERDIKNLLKFFKKLGIKSDFEKILERVKKTTKK